MPQEGVGKYFLALVPPSPVYEEALALKHLMQQNYGAKAALRSPPHITLHMPFEWKTKKEAQLIEGLDMFAAARQKFSVELKNFGSFAPRVIFINVLATETLQLLQKELERFCKIRFNLFNAQYKDMAFHPHLTIAFRDLKKPQFAKAWQEFENKVFAATFLVDSLVLLRHDGTKWVPIHHARF